MLGKLYLIVTSINEQSNNDIAQNKTQNKTKLLCHFAHKIKKKLREVRENGTLPWWLRPDGKTQVPIQYFGNVAQYITSIVENDAFIYEIDEGCTA